MSKKGKIDYPSLIIPNTPAITFNDKEYGETLVISDLHIGYLYGKNRKGIVVPLTETPEKDTIKLVEKILPKRIIFLGDFKDEIFGSTHPLAGRIWKFLKELSTKTHITIIKGNHDGKIEELLPDEIELIDSSGIQVQERNNNFSIGLWHGHATPALDVMGSQITISGHAHPAYSFRDSIGSKITEKVWVKAKWNVENKEEQRFHIIMPAFNRYIDGYPVDEKLFETTVLMREAIDFLNAEVFTLEGVLLGTINELQEDRSIIQKDLVQRREMLKKIRKKRW